MIDEKFIKDLLLKIEQKLNVENDKLDLKQKWYDLTKPEQREELCKDISAIANTTGYEDGYIIIGIDEGTGKLYDSPFSKSGLNDLDKMRGIVVRMVDRPADYTLQEIQILDKKDKKKKTLSIIKIPPSLSKPHMLKSFKNRDHYIPIKKSTGTHPATRDDLEMMFYDRSKIEPENRITMNVYEKKIEFNSDKYEEGILILPVVKLVIDNSGTRPCAIADMCF